MQSKGNTSSKDIANVRIVSPLNSNFFFINLEFFFKIQLILIIYINKLMVLIFKIIDNTK
jgi:hypothetical protein